MGRRSVPRIELLILGVTATAAALAGCAPSELRRIAFLGDLSRMQPVETAEEFQAWREDPRTPRTYLRAQVEPVMIKALSAAPGATPNGTPEMERIGSYFRQAIMRAINDRYPIADAPGPDTIQIRTAILGIEAWPPRLPAGGIRSDSSMLPMPLEVDRVSVETELRDSLTGERMLAMIERDAARSELLLESWPETEAVLDRWAGLVRARLDAIHGRTAP